MSKKLLKRLSIASGLFVAVGFLAFWVLFFFPFEGRATEIRDMVPRGVDFFVAKADLAGDFEGESLNFPYVPALEEMGQTRRWIDVKDGDLYRQVDAQLRQLRRAFEGALVDAKVHTANFLDEFLGTEIQVAGYFGNQGFEDATWCAYARISAWAKMGYGWLLENEFSRDLLRQQGITIENDGEFFKITAQGAAYYCVRLYDVLMVGNDREMLSQSFELAQGNFQDVEPLGPSAHYIDGVRRPLQEWKKQTGISVPNVAEFHLQPNKLAPTMPSLRGWGKNIAEDNRNEKILASFINLESWRFLSGTAIFEPRSLSLLTHLVVNENMHTKFQKGLFNDNVQLRSEWMDEFFGMVPQNAVAAAALRLPAGDFINELFEDVLDRDERVVINEQLKKTGKYKNFAQLVAQIDGAVRPRVGVILRPNRRSDKTKQTFDVHNESPFPQWAWVFWTKRDRRGRLMSKPLSDLIRLLNSHRGAFNVTKAYTLKLAGGGSKDVAFEFAIPQIPGTGNIAVCTYGEYFIFGNSGLFIDAMAQALVLPNVPSMREDKDYQEFEEEMSAAVNGVGFVWAENLRKVGEDFKTFSEKLDSFMDNSWARKNRPKAEQATLRRYRQYRSLSQAQKSADWSRISKEIESTLDGMWSKHQKSNRLAGVAELQQFLDLTEVFRTAYVQMVMKSDSLQVRGRVLERGYVR